MRKSVFIVLQLHPDKLDGSLSEKERKKAYEKFLAIDKAWKVLCDQEMRQNCDRQLKGMTVYFEVNK